MRAPRVRPDRRLGRGPGGSPQRSRRHRPGRRQVHIGPIDVEAQHRWGRSRAGRRIDVELSLVPEAAEQIRYPDPVGDGAGIGWQVLVAQQSGALGAGGGQPQPAGPRECLLLMAEHSRRPADRRVKSRHVDRPVSGVPIILDAGKHQEHKETLKARLPGCKENGEGSRRCSRSGSARAEQFDPSPDRCGLCIAELKMTTSRSRSHNIPPVKEGSAPSPRAHSRRRSRADVERSWRRSTGARNERLGPKARIRWRVLRSSQQPRS